MGLLLVIAGLLSLGVAAMLFYVHRTFFAGRCQNLPGKVVELVQHESVSKDAFNRVNDAIETQEPIVEFFYMSQYYRFQANVDALANSLRVGSDVQVLINTVKYPRTAKLALEAKTYQLLMVISVSLSIILFVAGVWLFDVKALVYSLSNLFTSLWLVGLLFCLCLMMIKLLFRLQTLPVFSENIVESNQNNK